MSNDRKDEKMSTGETGDMTVTYTQIASCAVSPYATEPMRLSLRARLEREHEERELERKSSLGYRIRSLFNPATS